MPICAQSVQQLIGYLGETETAEIVMLAKKVESLEANWKAKAESFLDDVTSKIVNDLIYDGKVSSDDYEFEKFYVEHFFEVAYEAIRSANQKDSLAKYPKGKMPSTLKELMELWDKWRNKGEAPKRAAAIAEEVKKAYIKKCQDAYQKYSHDYREGKEFNQTEVVRQVQRAAKSEYARSKMIVETETTRHWNQVRRGIYDESPSVTSYLYMAIRDQRTTKWCKTRHGLVYDKNHPELPKVCPSHWNCRSEILPLTPANPRHKKLIEDESKNRRNHKPEPLPPGWGAA